MTIAHIIGGDLAATNEDRVVAGMLLPYGVVGATNLGRFSVDPGVVKIPRTVEHLNINEEHSQMAPRGRFLAAEETPQGITARFKVAETDEGDALLARIEDGRKAGRPVALSVEVADIFIQAGKAISGALTGAAFVERGAFPGAALLAAAADTPAAPEPIAAPAPGGEPIETTETTSEEFVDEQGVTRTRTVTRTTRVETDADGKVTQTITEKTVIDDPTPTTPEQPAPSTTTTATPKESAVLPNTLTATAKPAAPAAPDYREVKHLMAAVAAGNADDRMLGRLSGQFSTQHSLFAALTDVKYDAAGSPVPYNAVPQWIGELYHGLDYVQLVADLIAHRDLTAKTVTGFSWVTKPAGGDWAGNKTNIPSNAPATAPYSLTADLFSGGHDIAIEHKLFNTPGYFEAYWEAMGESYKRWVDAKVAAKLISGATALVADNPAGLTIGAGLSAIIDGAVAVVAANALPTFALVHPTLYKQALKVPQNNVIGYLSAALNFREGELNGFVIRPYAGLATGNVIVGAKDAAVLYELPGVPVRVEAPDIVKGGIDTNMFGAAAVGVEKADAIVKVTPFA